MKKSTKAALLSLFVFPGVGLLWLKNYARGLLFFMPALAAIAYLIKRIAQTAMSVYDNFLQRVIDGQLIVDASNSTQVAHQIYIALSTALAQEQATLQKLEYFFIACWLCSALSSYFVGLKEDQKNAELQKNKNAAS